MGREYFYKPGSFYRLCDRTGFRVRAERTRMEWDNLIVRDQSWEIRQPQDFVRGVRDEQTVPDPRIRPVTQFIGPAQSTLGASASFGDTYLTIVQPFAVFVGNTIAIVLDYDMGAIFFTKVLALVTAGDFNTDFSPDFSIGGTSANVFINPRMPGFASSGNAVTNISTPEIQPSQYGASNGN